MASVAGHDAESATERRNPASRRTPHSRQFPPSTHSLPMRSSSSPPKSPYQQDVRIRSPHGQENEGYGSRPGGRGGRAPNFRRGGRWRGKAPQNRNMTEDNAIGESLSPIDGSVRPKGKNVEIGNVTMQGKKPDTSPAVETFVRRWGEEPSATKESHGVEDGGYVNVPSLASMTKTVFAANSNNRGRQRGWWGRSGRMVENRSNPHGSISMESAIPGVSSFASTPSQQTHDGVPKTWRSKPGNPGTASKQHVQEPGKLFSGALNEDGDDHNVAVLRKAERVRQDVQNEDGVLSPSFTNLNKRGTDMKMKNVEGGGWGDHSWGDKEALADGPSGWDDFVETTTQMKISQKWKAKGVAHNGGLNMNDFDCCDTEVTILGERVLVTVAATAATIEKWLQEHQGKRRFGFDIEWKPTTQKGDYSDAATLQLSTEKHCLLVQLLFVNHFPECLKNLLADPIVVLGGVGIKVDLPIHPDFHILRNFQKHCAKQFRQHLRPHCFMQIAAKMRTCRISLVVSVFLYVCTTCNMHLCYMCDGLDHSKVQ